ncbi:MAG: hypothetical protein IJ751_00430, partial [Oscillospiraceae bacterium]|nr:hypothetical protein [Oscillospiraceae bacterium]
MVIAGMTLYQIGWYFLIYAFLGWVVEVIYHAVTQGAVVNRGFLNGPLCPIYGVGMLGVLALSNSVTSPSQEPSLPLLFLGGTLLATGVELLGGWALDKIFHAKWWDYSDRPFNLHGYICLQFSLIWGLAIVLVMRVLHPLVRAQVTAWIPEKIGWPILIVAYVLFLADLVVTAAMLHALDRRLAELEQISANMRVVSDRLTQVIADKSISAARRVGESKVQAALGRAEMRENLDARVAETRQELEERRAALEQRLEALTGRTLKKYVFGPRRI